MKAGVSILISHKIAFKMRSITKDKVGNFMINRLINQEYITILNINTLNSRTTKYTKQKLTKWNWKLDKSAIVAGDFNTPFKIIDRIYRPTKISKDIENLNNTTGQLRLTDIYKILKAAVEKTLHYLKGGKNNVNADFSPETLKSRRKWHTFQVLKEKTINPKSVKINFNNEG